MIFLCYFLIFSTIAQPALFSPYLGEARVFLILSAIVCIAAYKKQKEPGWWKNIPQNKLIVLMLLAYTLSEAQHLWLGGTINTFVFWFNKVLIYYAVLVFIDTPARLKTAVWMSVLASTVLAYFALEYYLADPTLAQFEGRLQSVGNYNLSNSYALLLTVIWPLAFVLFELEKSVLRKIFLAALMAVFLYFDFLTKSRGGILGMTVAICLSFIMSRKIAKHKFVKAAFIACVLLVVLVYGLAFIKQRTDIGDSLGDDVSSTDRLMAWVAATKMLVAHPIIGVGWQRFPDVVTDYGSDRHMLAHNTIISVFAETGLFGGIVFMLILKNSISQLYKTYRESAVGDVVSQKGILAQGLFISLAAFLVNTSFSVKDHDPCYWLIIALTAAGTRIINKKEYSLEGSAGLNTYEEAYSYNSSAAKS